MNRCAITFFIAIAMGQSTFTYAQNSLIGKYNGFFEIPPAKNSSAAIEILTVTGETVSGIGHRFEGRCSGEYPISGKLQGNILKMRQTKLGGATGDCGFRLTLTVEGNNLVGTFGDKFPAKFSK